MKAVVTYLGCFEHGKTYDVVGEQQTVAGKILKILRIHSNKTETFYIDHIAVLQEGTNCYQIGTFFEEIVVPNKFKYFVWDGEIWESYIERSQVTGKFWKLYKPTGKKVTRL